LIFGIAVGALIALITALFVVYYLTYQHLTADMWDEDFTDKLRCYFYDCATDNGDVIHFDLQCIQNKILAATILDFSAPQLLVLLQVSTIFLLLGGQVIDAAGATTAVTTADCDDCGDGWCFVVELADTDGGFLPLTGQGTYVSGTGWVADCAVVGGVNRTIVQGGFSFPQTVHLLDVAIDYAYEGGTRQAGVTAVGAWVNNFSESFMNVDMNAQPDCEDCQTRTMVNLDATSVEFDLQASHGDCTGSAWLYRVTLRGDGEKPDFLLDDGWTEC